MADNPISFRADEETKAKFAKICEQFSSKGAALQALIEAHELNSAKATLPGCATLIEDFRAHLEAVSRSYIGQLELTANTEERVRAEFAAQLDSLSKALQTSQTQAQAAQETAAKAQAALDEVKTTSEQERSKATTMVAEYSDKAERAEQARQAAEQSATDSRRTSDALAAQLENVTAERDRLRAESEKITTLSEQLAKANAEINRLQTAQQVAAAQAAMEKAQAVADVERSLRDRLDAKQDELEAMRDKYYSIKDELQKTQAMLNADRTSKE